MGKTEEEIKGVHGAVTRARLLCQQPVICLEATSPWSLAPGGREAEHVRGLAHGLGTAAEGTDPVCRASTMKMCSIGCLGERCSASAGSREKHPRCDKIVSGEAFYKRAA